MRWSPLPALQRSLCRLLPPCPCSVVPAPPPGTRAPLLGFFLHLVVTAMSWVLQSCGMGAKKEAPPLPSAPPPCPSPLRRRRGSVPAVRPCPPCTAAPLWAGGAPLPFWWQGGSPLHRLVHVMGEGNRGQGQHGYFYW